MDKLAYMAPTYESEICAVLSEWVSHMLKIPMDASKIHLSARDADASCHLPQDTIFERADVLKPCILYNAPLVQDVRSFNGWLLFDFSSEFFSALVDRVHADFTAPTLTKETYALNKMRVLSLHDGVGCPDLPAFHRALLLSICAHNSPAAYQRAEHAALTLFHRIHPRDRIALFTRCGAFGGAMLRLLSAASRN